MNKKVKLVITDLDGTLYSWENYFVPAFEALVDSLVDYLSFVCTVSKDEVKEEFRQLHVGSGEMEEIRNAIKQLPLLHQRFTDMEDFKDAVENAIKAFQAVQKEKLKLYPGVKETLQELTEQGVRVVAFTESSSGAAMRKLHHLGIYNYFTEIYHAVGVRGSFGPKCSIMRQLQTKKPDYKALLYICANEDVLPSETIYIGDSMTKDILMASEAEITSIRVNAEYVCDETYQNLLKISSWSRADFNHDMVLKRRIERRAIRPDHIVSDFRKVADIVLQKYRNKELAQTVWNIFEHDELQKRWYSASDIAYNLSIKVVDVAHILNALYLDGLLRCENQYNCADCGSYIGITRISCFPDSNTKEVCSCCGREVDLGVICDRFSWNVYAKK